ncbi:hypothetical protein ACH4TX_05540 [Streptomyces sp. NPDC021098]|uniref:hypothetical protein n=1 Tax=unclassified Streptomyces TaxID=2593676 RepID=UPI0037931D10
MKFKTIGATVVASLASLAVLGGTQSASAADWLTAKAPTYKSGKVTASATMLGPQPAGTKLCVSLLVAHPYYPDIEVANKCKTTQAGSVSVTAKVGTCGKYSSYASVKRNGGTSVRKSNAAIYCK